MHILFRAFLASALLAGCAPDPQSSAPSVEACQVEWEAALLELEAVQALLAGQGSPTESEELMGVYAAMVAPWGQVVRFSLGDYGLVYANAEKSGLTRWPVYPRSESPEELDPEYKAQLLELRELAELDLVNREDYSNEDWAGRMTDQRERLVAMMEALGPERPTRAREILGPPATSHELLAEARDGDADRIVQAAEQASLAYFIEMEPALAGNRDRQAQLEHRLAVASLRLDLAIVKAAGGSETPLPSGALDRSLPRVSVDSIAVELEKAQATRASSAYMARFCSSAREEIEEIQAELTLAVQAQPQQFDVEDVTVEAGSVFWSSYSPNLRAGGPGSRQLNESEAVAEEATNAWKFEAAGVLETLNKASITTASVALPDPHYERGRRRLDTLSEIATKLDTYGAVLQSSLDEHGDLRERYAAAVRALRDRRTQVLREAYAPRPTR